MNRFRSTFWNVEWENGKQATWELLEEIVLYEESKNTVLLA